MELQKMTTKVVNIDLLKENKENPRVIKPGKYQELLKSLTEFPEMKQYKPIYVNKDMVVLGGNQRLKACKELGWKKVPTMDISELSEEKQQELLIKDNTHYGEWGWSQTTSNWDRAKLKQWGVPVPGLPTPKKGVDDKYTPPKEIKTNIKEGDLIEIGPHMLMCGSSTEAEPPW